MREKITSRRLKVAVAVAICLVALIALSAVAMADAVWTSEFPAPSSTAYVSAGAKLTVVSAQLFGQAVDTKSVVMTVNGSAVPVVVTQGSAQGNWSATQTLVGGTWRTHWTWAAGGSGSSVTVQGFPPALANGAVTVAITAKDTNGVAITGDSWSFTQATNPAPVPVPTPPTPLSTICVSCHYAGSTTASGVTGNHAKDYVNDVAMGADCISCHSGANAPIHGIPTSTTIHLSLQPMIAANSAGCVSCHGSNLRAVLPGEHIGCSCHVYHEATASVDACEDCHAKPMDPTAPYPYHVSSHTTETAYLMASTKAATCAAPTCHGTDLLDVSADSLHIAGEHKGCLCHAYGEASAPKDCVDCHDGGYAPHGFVDGTDHAENGAPAAGGHNTTTYDVKGGTSQFGPGEVEIKSSAGTTITQEWALPNASVFWSQSNLGSLSPTDAPLVAMANRGFASAAAGAAAIRTDVGWGSVITCQDCHTNLTMSGPQGANFAAATLDPNFPDDWTKAEITSFDPTGMRKIDTTRDSLNPYYTKLGSNVYMPAEVENAADPNNPWVGMSIETTSMRAVGTSAIATSNPAFTAVPGFGNTSNITVYPGGFYGLTNVPSNGYSMGDSTGRFICQKCHKLTNSFQGLGIEGNGRGARDNNLNYMGMSNEAHMEHHNDMVTGQGNCVSCHIAIPHGWKRPRLLVYESDPAPYKVQRVWTDYRSTDLNVLRNMNPTNLYTSGNWGFLSNPTATTTSRYGIIGQPNASDPTSEPLSAHLSKIDASTAALKELAVGPAEEFESYDTSNAAAFSAITGIGVDWGGWNMSSKGVAWIGNPNGATIPATFWDANTNAPVAGVEAPIQNNCNACSSAGAGTHTPQWTGNTGGEGVQGTLPYWK